MRYSMQDIRSTFKNPDSWWGHYIMSPVSGCVLWCVANFTSLPPEFFTVSMLIVALCAVPFFLQGDHQSLIIGAGFAFASDVFDGVNGKLARLKGVASPLGGYLDTILDIIKIMAFLISLPLGQYLYTGDFNQLVWGLGVCCIVLFTYYNENLLGRIRAFLPPPTGNHSGEGVKQHPVFNLFASVNRFFRDRSLFPAPGGSEFGALMFMVGPLTNQVLLFFLIGGAWFVLYIMAYTAMIMIRTKGLTQGLEKDRHQREKYLQSSEA